MTTVSISGIRGVFNEDLRQAEVLGYVRGFARLTGANEFLVGRDTRSTGEAMKRATTGALLGAGGSVIDFGVVSTPALFRESRKRQSPAVMVTASHNDPEWNGLKFLVNGRGINQAELGDILKTEKGLATLATGRPKHAAAAYNSELIAAAGEASCHGVKVVLDLNGGAAVRHAPMILRALGCEVMGIGETEGVFTRRIDPTNDPLTTLTSLVKKKEADVGFAFDCDGDRLVLVDSNGRKRTGDYMLTFALRELLPKRTQRTVVVSQDTTQAIDDLVADEVAVHRSPVGEANVVSMMMEKGATLGGEGSSGGLIDSSYNYCRDSMVAAIAIVGAIARSGTKVYDQVKSYSQSRLSIAMSRRKALAAIKKLRKEYKNAEMVDGAKVWVSPRSWVLVRSSNTEDIVRVSSEAPSGREAEELAKSFLNKVRRLGA